MLLMSAFRCETLVPAVVALLFLSSANSLKLSKLHSHRRRNSGLSELANVATINVENAFEDFQQWRNTTEAQDFLQKTQKRRLILNMTLCRTIQQRVDALFNATDSSTLAVRHVFTLVTLDL